MSTKCSMANAEEVPGPTVFTFHKSSPFIRDHHPNDYDENYIRYRSEQAFDALLLIQEALALRAHHFRILPL
jgi:hypothetical protein